MDTVETTPRRSAPARPIASARSGFLAAALGLLVAACTTPMHSAVSVPGGVGVRADVGVAVPPYTSVPTEWKERLDQPYVFLELLGPYEETIGFMPELSQHLANQGIRAAGAPFALYYDDPMRVASTELRSRLCVPVAPGTAVGAPLGYMILPSEQVVYAHVAGPYDSVSAAYPAMFDVLRERAWVLDGPIREIYLVDPNGVQSLEELITEIQMPWRPL